MKITLNQMSAFGGKTAILTGQEPMREYKDGKATGNTVGMTFSVVAHGTNFTAYSVKVEGAKPLNFSDEEIAEACASLNPIFVTFEGFKGKVYSINNDTNASCTAKSVKVVSRDEALAELDLFGGDN